MSPSTPIPIPARLTLRQLLELNGNRLTIRDFMDLALYDPDFGYYTANINTVGRRGDFSTSATLHRNVIGGGIARWARSAFKTHPKPWHLIEVGAGDGSLAEAVLDALGWAARRRITYHIVESSPILTRQQQSRLPHGAATWHTTMPSAATACGGRAVVFSNELADAFPATVLAWNAALRTWNQVFLELRDNGAVEEVPDPSPIDPELGPGLQNHPFNDAQRIEIHLSWREWLSSWIPRMRQLDLLTIDYGDRFPNLYHRKPLGTLRGFFHHTPVNGPELYQRVGNQDLTADVNFSALSHWGDELGLKTLTFSNQRDFILNHRKPRRSDPDDDALQFLINPDGAGGAFKILHQRLNAD